MIKNTEKPVEKKHQNKVFQNADARLSFEIPFEKYERYEKGTATIKGIAFTKAKSKWGLKVGQRIYADQIKVTLFPVTPYLESWYALRKEKESLRKRRYVYLSKDAYRYRLEAFVEVNQDGEIVKIKLN